ncbi:MAG: hypothetical protein Q4F00_02550 [bacterium]|nr:hypothetical protein [bacterium]
MADETDSPKDTQEYKLVVIPAHEELKRKVEKLRAEVSMLVLERDQLRYVVCRNLERAYMLAVGALEHQAFEAKCAVLRLKRKLEMIQAKRNREETVVLAQINKALDVEFAEYQQKLNEQIEKINQAIEDSKCRQLSDDETKELKKMYSAIVKAMHPDLHPNQSEAEQKLFINAIKAYKNGDIKTIRIIYTMREKYIPEENEDIAATLSKDKKRLEGVLTALKEEIAKIKAEFPCTMEAFLDDQEQIEAKKRELQATIDQYQDMIKKYQERIDEIMR